MTKLVLRCVTQGTLLMALIAALSFTPAFAMGGGGGGGGGGGVGGGGGGGTYPSSLLRLDAPSSYPRRSGIKTTHNIKKNARESSTRRPGL